MKENIGKTLVRSMKKFLRQLKSGKPIKVTRVERFDTPDGPMHVQSVRYLKRGFLERAAHRPGESQSRTGGFLRRERMAEFGLKKSFHIGDGQLDGKTPQECFVLGYELAMIDEKLARPSAFSCYVHVENRERVEESCRDKSREFKLNWLEGDSSESWLWLIVHPDLSFAQKLKQATEE